MSWFGWLTKPQLEVSMLDRLTMLGELCLLVVIVFGAGGVYDVYWKQRRGKR